MEQEARSLPFERDELPGYRLALETVEGQREPMLRMRRRPGGEGAAARLCLIAIGLALVSLLISEWLARVSRQRMGG